MYTVLKSNIIADNYSKLIYVTCFDNCKDAHHYCEHRNKRAIDPVCCPDSVFTYYYVKGILVLPKKGD